MLLYDAATSVKRRVGDSCRAEARRPRKARSPKTQAGLLPIHFQFLLCRNFYISEAARARASASLLIVVHSKTLRSSTKIAHITGTWSLVTTIATNNPPIWA